jgi:4-hydroxy-3-polyprenylbenzoate decarboxylase
MAFASFSAFLTALEKAGELIRVPVPVATELEITAWADAEMKKPGGGKALLFEKPTVNGVVSSVPLAINTLGSERRMAMSLGLEKIDQLADEMRLILKAKPPTSLKQAWTLAKQGLSLLNAKPKRVKDGPCKEVVHRFDGPAAAASALPTLLDLPILQCWPQDGGRFITFPCVHTKDPDTGERNLGMYRMQVYDDRSTGMHWQVHKVGARHGKRYYERGERMPVAVTLGGDPAHIFAATAPLPDGLDEILFSGFIRKKSVELVPCETIPLEVPADADFVLEGYVQPGEFKPEGPFGDHTGFYTPVDDYPVFHLTAITHRKTPVYPCTIVGIPPMEDYYMGTASVRIFVPVFQMNFPEIVDLALPAEGVFHNLVVVSIRKQYAWQAYKIMHGLWGMGQMMFSKYIIVVDEDCDVHNLSEVMFRVCANTDPQRDTTFVKSPCDALDHGPTVPCIGTHMGIDATKKLASEGYTRKWPEMLKMDAGVTARVEEMIRRRAGK